MSGPILVTGATGNTGSALLDLLVERGADVRAMVRGPAQLPEAVTQVVADFDDAASLAAALGGVERAYLVTPSSERAQAQQERFADAAVEAGVQHLVVLSQLASDEQSPVRFLRYHAAVEQHVEKLGIDYTFLRPNLFFQGLLAFAGSVAADSRIYAPIGTAKVSAVDVRDIAAVAAAALTETGHDGRTYTITGPSAITHAEIADALGEALGRPIAFVDVTPEMFAQGIEGLLPPWQVAGLLEDYAHYRRGEAAEVTATVEEVTGRPARDVRAFAHDYASFFAGS